MGWAWAELGSFDNSDNKDFPKIPAVVHNFNRARLEEWNLVSLESLGHKITSFSDED